jgi:puromycin-sensitive aminopeptidase
MGQVSRKSQLHAGVTRRHLLRALRRTAVLLAGLGLTLAWPVRRRAAACVRPFQEDRPGYDESRRAAPVTGRKTVDPYRLPRHVVPTRYELRLEPDLPAHAFTGRETVTVTVVEPTAEILLNAVELDVTDARIAPATGESLTGRIELDEALERCRLIFPRQLEPGTWRLQLAFQGTLNDKLRGFYRSTYQDQQGQAKLLAATQFEATDARRAFPCWDEPDFKAVFASTLVIDPALTAVSNTRVVAEAVEAGRKVVQFAETIRMSTYLVAFVVGELEASRPVAVGQTALRVWSVPGKQPLSAFGQAIGAFSLGFFEDYYGIAYPGDKLDLLAIPDFASGAMENLGAITFRETALLVDEKAATHAELERVADVVAHENAHMWFGDLVTMSWWNGLWLNEAFATFMEMLAVDAWKPQWQRWTTFGVSRAAALSVDGLRSSRPIEYPVRAPKDADAMFDVLTYEKGASVLRMLEQHIGPPVFRDGVRRYLRAHAHANADTGDLWTALGEAARQPVPDLMDGWIFQPGYPLLSVAREGRRLTLRQQHFTYLAEPAGAKGHPAPRHWQVPLQVRLVAGGRVETRRLLMKEESLGLDLPAGVESIVVNEGGHGFYRVRYAPDLLEALLSWLDRLAAIERFNLVNDAWATTVAGLMPVADYLDLTGRFRHEKDRNVWAVIVESFQSLYRLVEPAGRPRFEALVRDRLAPMVAALGWMPQAGEDELTRQLRGDLLRAMGTTGNDPAIQREAAALYARSLKQPEAVDPNVLPALIAILAYVGDRGRYEDFYRRFRQAATPQEERRYLYALAAFRLPELLEETLTRSLSDDIRKQDAPFLIRLVLGNVYGRERAWAFVKAQWDRMDRLFPKQGQRRMLEGIAGLTTPELEQDVHRFVAERKIDLGGKTLEQYLEQLRIGVAFTQRETAAVRQYLAAWQPSPAAR